MSYKISLLGFLLISISSLVYAQGVLNTLEENESDSTEFDIFGNTEDGFSLINEMPLTLNMEREMELVEEAKEARKQKEKRV